MKQQANKIVAENRKARHDFNIHETYETGIELRGTEVKSLRAGKANLKDSYAIIKKGEMFLLNMHISHYDQGNIFNHDETRTRKLLMHKKEILKLSNQTQMMGYTLVPLKLYFKKNHVKILIGMAKGRKTYDKREVLKKKDMERQIQKDYKGY